MLLLLGSVKEQILCTRQYYELRWFGFPFFHGNIYEVSV